MEKLTDNEIIKALECCSEVDNCEECPLCESCNRKVFNYALALINRQKAEIERLNTELVGMRGAANSYKMHYDKSQAENKELWGERNRIYASLQETKSDLEEYRKACARVKSEARKEFAERLKEETEQNTFDNGYVYSGTLDVIVDDLVKEMDGK